MGLGGKRGGKRVGSGAGDAGGGGLGAAGEGRVVGAHPSTRASQDIGSRGDPSTACGGQLDVTCPRHVSSSLPHLHGEEIQPYRRRHDGFTGERQKRFIETLAKTGCVKDAAAAVGVTKTTAYRARKRIPDFAAAWETALAMARTDIEQVAWQRAVEGADVPIVHGGKVTDTYKKPSDAMLRLLYTRGNSGKMLRASDGRFRAMPPAEELLCWEDWEEGWRFSWQGVKCKLPSPAEARAALKAEILQIRRRLLGLPDEEDEDEDEEEEDEQEGEEKEDGE